MLCFDTPTRPIGFSEGIGHVSGGGSFTLQDTMDSQWDEHLETCGCLWLRDLALEEKKNGETLSPNEIYGRWMNIKSKQGSKAETLPRSGEYGTLI